MKLRVREVESEDMGPMDLIKKLKLDSVDS